MNEKIRTGLYLLLFIFFLDIFNNAVDYESSSKLLAFVVTTVVIVNALIKQKKLEIKNEAENYLVTESVRISDKKEDYYLMEDSIEDELNFLYGSEPDIEERIKFRKSFFGKKEHIIRN